MLDVRLRLIPTPIVVAVASSGTACVNGADECTESIELNGLNGTASSVACSCSGAADGMGAGGISAWLSVFGRHERSARE